MFASKCPYLPTILKFQEILIEKMGGKIYVNQDDDVSDLHPANYEPIYVVFYS